APLLHHPCHRRRPLSAGYPGDGVQSLEDGPCRRSGGCFRCASPGPGARRMKHDIFERHSMVLLVGILVVVAIGGLVEIAPLFWVNGTVEQVSGMRPYTPLELEGRNIYVREGCYLCHSQQIRSLRDEVERYGHYSLAAESMYDHPFQWGSERTGPDLARVGGKYSNDWQYAHLIEPSELVPETIMPSYAFLASHKLQYEDIA